MSDGGYEQWEKSQATFIKFEEAARHIHEEVTRELVECNKTGIEAKKEIDKGADLEAPKKLQRSELNWRGSEK